MEEEKRHRVGGRMEGQRDGSSLRRWLEAAEPRAGERSCGLPWAFCRHPLVGLVALHRDPEETSRSQPKAAAKWAG